MRSLLLVVLLGGTVAWGQSSPSSSNAGTAPSDRAPSAAPSGSGPSNPNQSNPDHSSSEQPGGPSGSPTAPPSSSSVPQANSGASGATANPQPPPAPSSKPYNPILAAPRSDTVSASTLEDGESSSKDTQMDLSPPADDLKAHPGDLNPLKDEGSTASSASDIHPWDPHRAAKDIEVGDFYFKQKNYVGAADRYREALLYKDNDAMATFRLAECLEKLEQPAEAKKEYESYLKILPNGPEAEKVHKALDRLNASASGK